MFKEILHGIKSGAKFLAEKIWSGLKAVFGSQKAKEISLAALDSAKALLSTEFGQFVQKVIVELEASELEGPARLATATDNIKAYLSEQGKSMSTVWIQWAIQTILAFVRGMVKA